MNQPKIKVLQYMHGNFQYFGWSERINRLYCERHGYEYRISRNEPRGDRHVNWQKVTEILRELHDCDDLLFLDADAVFYAHELRIEEELLPISEQKSVTMSQDCGSESLRWHPGLPNSGVILVRNDAVAKKIFTEWDASSEIDTESRWNWPLEQTAFWRYILPQYKGHITVVGDYYRMQGHFGQYIRHFMLQSDAERCENMKRILYRLEK